jgi:hypothetical protein
MKTTLKTSGKENYTQNEWNYGLSSTAWLYRNSLITLKLHSKQVGMKTTLKTSENKNYTHNEWEWKLQSKQVRMNTTLKTSEIMDLLALPTCHWTVWSL